MRIKNKKAHSSGLFCPENLLLLIELHTIFVMIFYEQLSPIYVFSGFSFLFLKGLFFFLFFRDNFGIADMIISLFLLLLIWNVLPFIFWILFLIYFIIRIILGLTHLNHHHH